MHDLLLRFNKNLHITHRSALRGLAPIRKQTPIISLNNTVLKAQRFIFCKVKIELNAA
jgi:hypothetical protein